MPTYQYVCTACSTPLEVQQAFSDDPLSECPTCQGRLRKVFSAVGVVFKGSGFYRTDSRPAAEAGTSSGPAKEAPTGDGASGGDGTKPSGGSGDTKSTGSTGSDTKGSGSTKTSTGSSTSAA